MSNRFAILLLGLCAMFAVGQAFDKAAAIAEFTAASEECRAKVGATEKDVQELISTQSASSMEGKCLHACLMKKFKVMTDDGKFNAAVANEHAKMFTDNDPEKVKVATEITSICSAIAVPDDHCLAADAICKCIKEQLEARGIEQIRFE